MPHPPIYARCTIRHTGTPQFLAAFIKVSRAKIIEYCQDSRNDALDDRQAVCELFETRIARRLHPSMSNTDTVDCELCPESELPSEIHGRAADLKIDGLAVWDMRIRSNS
jgi:hypothetical protein